VVKRRRPEPQESTSEANELCAERCGKCGSADLIWSPKMTNVLLHEVAFCERCGSETTTEPASDPPSDPPLQPNIFTGELPTSSVSFDQPTSTASRRTRPEPLTEADIQAVRRIPKRAKRAKRAWGEPLPPLA
jgi:hypothetical protein